MAKFRQVVDLAQLAKVAQQAKEMVEEGGGSGGGGGGDYSSARIHPLGEGTGEGGGGESGGQGSSGGGGGDIGSDIEAGNGNRMTSFDEPATEYPAGYAADDQSPHLGSNEFAKRKALFQMNRGLSYRVGLVNYWMSEKGQHYLITTFQVSLAPPRVHVSLSRLALA
jgi:hypothetical protein